MQKDEVRTQVEVLRAECGRVRDSYRAAIENAGFKVETNTCTDRSVLVIPSPKVGERSAR